MPRRRLYLLLTLTIWLAAALPTSLSAEPASKPAKTERQTETGLRILSTGHSWVAPAMRTLPKIAAGAGLDDHRQRQHIRGGAGGSARAVWAVEHGLLGIKKQVLLPLIASGQWDVLTMGSYYFDKPEYYTPWIDYCLKHNPKMTFLIQDGWARVPRRVRNSSLKLEMFLPEQKKIDKTIKTIVEKLDEKYPDKVRVIPVGAAMSEMLRLYFADKLPGIDGVSQHLGSRHALYRDGGHLCGNSGMEWFEGYVYYAALYKKSPELLDFKSKVPNDKLDKIMRRVAWKAVVDYPLARIDDDNKNGIADEIEKAAGKR